MTPSWKELDISEGFKNRFTSIRMYEFLSDLNRGGLEGKND